MSSISFGGCFKGPGAAFILCIHSIRQKNDTPLAKVEKLFYFLLHKLTSGAPIGAWKFNFPPFLFQIMTDRPTNQQPDIRGHRLVTLPIIGHFFTSKLHSHVDYVQDIP